MQTFSPTTTEELSAAVQSCAAQNLVLTPTGGRTKLDWGNAVNASAEINTAQLNGVHEHSWGDLTATVAAGTPWATMQQTLAQHGQRVALDPLFAHRATVGGVLAANDSGLLRMKYGSLRDLVLGMTIVLADGTIARTGGKVVKNVAGYDLPKLLTGSFGTLGLIAEATFRLHPIPQQTASFIARSAEITPLADLMHSLVISGMSLETMQLRNKPQTFALDVQFASLPEVLAEHEQRLRSLAASLIVESSGNDIWQEREALFVNPSATILKITTLSTKLAALVGGFALLNTLPEHTAHCVADPVGIVTAAITAPADKLPILVDDLRARLAAIGGAVVVLRRGHLATTVDTWGTPPAAIDVMRSIKQEFDPQHLLNPGKFVGGI